MTSTHVGEAALNEYPDGLETEDAIMNAFMTPEEGDDAEEPSKKKVKSEDDDTTAADDTEADDDTTDAEEPSEDEEGDDSEDQEDEKSEDEDKASKKYADDADTYVKVKVGEEEHEVKVADLKRLYGQEASLTRKSQEAAELRKAVEADQARNIAAYDVMLKRSTERANSYRELPWTQLMKDPQVPADQLAALQAEAQKAFEDEAFLKNELDGFMQKVTGDQMKARQESARECLKAINTPESKHHIKGWNEALYNDIRSFAADEIGLDKELVNNLTDPGAFKVLHMAMQFARGSKKVVTTKVNKTPTKIVKNSASAPAARSSAKTVTVKAASSKAVKSGSQDDAINAFEAMFGDD
ncbi:hypothetical protein J2R95_003186 [Bradyrhizobium japonicum]|uniref:hypothetical protein n=1 Tax=Bradyrhizobium japonicum TaxID=375 RepID=UPI0020A12425|nr:hypothetical protein [Bradyrhizobium japonicum]MCP1937391.1 hypothetical protein [Bradyrhizobium japonicum]